MDLAVVKRERFGRSVKSLRKQGLVMAELYGRGIENLHLSVNSKDFKKVLHEAGENTLINIVLEDGTKRPVLIYDIQADPIKDNLLQVDFYQVRMDEKIKAKISIEFIGQSEAIKSGGVLVKSMQEIEVEALPADLPKNIEVNISSIKNIGESIYIKDLKIGKAVTIMVPGETVVATIVDKVTEEEEVKAAAEIKIESVAVESEEKKIERQSKKDAEGGTGVGVKAPTGKTAEKEKK
jgi:large subunit ribosomal protein L25